MSVSQEVRKRLLLITGAMVATTGLVAGCTSNEPAPVEGAEDDVVDEEPVAGGDAEPGEDVVIGYSSPAADHGWLGAMHRGALDTAESFEDVELRFAEGADEASLQISQVEQFINEGVDAIVLLPIDGALLTGVALDAMEAGIPVVNVDREFSSEFASRTTILGDNYGMGISAGQYICERLGGQEDAVVAEIAGIDSLPLTQTRSQGFEDALAECGLDVDNRVAAEFTVDSGQTAAAELLQAAPEIDAIWNHDDDQGVGVLAAIDAAGRDEFFMVGGAGSQEAMQHIADGDTVLEATVIYASTQSADGIRLARLIAQGEGMDSLSTAVVPKRIVLAAPLVTAENVDQYIDQAFTS